MPRQLLILSNEGVRARAMSFVSKAPLGYRVEIKEPKRTLEQNDALWAYLTDVAAQREHQGRKYDAETWKSIFMNALGTEMKFVPTLAGDSVFPLGMRSSKLSKREMSDLIEFIVSWGVQHGVIFHDKIVDPLADYEQRKAS